MTAVRGLGSGRKPGPRSRRVARPVDRRTLSAESPLPASRVGEAEGLEPAAAGDRDQARCVGSGDQALVPGGSVEPFSRQRRLSALGLFLARDPTFRGVGAVRAAKLEAAFGAGLHRALMNGDPRLSEVLGADIADALCAAWGLRAAEAETAAWLAGHDIDPGLAVRLMRVWGAEAGAHLRRNPYLLIGWVGWPKTDALARSLGIAADDPRRLAGAVESTLYARLDAKHTLTPTPALRVAVARLVGEEHADTAIGLSVADGGATRFGDGFQPVGASAMERHVAAAIAAMSMPARQPDLLVQVPSPTAIAAAIEAHDSGHTPRLTPAQRGAVALALGGRIACIVGHAGTGKTTVLRALAAVARGLGRTVHLMALSGRAARRITEAAGAPATTIAAFLRRLEDPRTPVGADALVVIDEASMLDLPTFHQILRRLAGAAVVLVGDPAQLPPIGFGLTFHAMVGVVPTATLDLVMRQTSASGIPAVADAIRNGRLPELGAFDGARPGVSFIPCNASAVLATLEVVGRRLAADGVKRGETQIITPLRGGPGGVIAINNQFHRLRARDKPKFPGRSDIAAGDPVIWTENDHDRDLQNGSMGRMVSVDPERRVAQVELDGRVFMLGREDAPRIEPAYAISVHKAQGSQWRRVIMPVLSSRILDRALVYTAATRATDQVIFVGDRSALDAAVAAAPSPLRRCVTLGERLRLS